MLMKLPKRKRRGRHFLSFRRDERGATAIEFAILALPFFMLVFNTIETAYSFAGRQVMANAADNVARKFRTGQVASVTEPALRTMVCNEIRYMVPSNCPDLLLDLRSEDTFQALTQTTIDPNGVVSGGPRYDTGANTAMSKNMLHVMYKWPIFTDLVGRFAYQMPNDRGKMLIVGVAIWQNEPF